jgi:gas vesicle protein
MIFSSAGFVGCQEEQADNSKAARLAVVENKELKTQMQAEIKKRDDEIQKLKEQIQNDTKKHNDEIQSFSNQLAQCEHDRTAGIKETEKKNKEQIDSMLSGVIAENQKLSDEIQQLNAELAKVKVK